MQQQQTTEMSLAAPPTVLVISRGKFILHIIVLLYSIVYAVDKNEWFANGQ